jgi:NTE family protein
MKSTPKNPALILSGGGARGAYEAGMIHYFRTQLPREVADRLRFAHLSGSSVGSINATYMAATAHDPAFQGKEIIRLWQNIHAKDIYQRGPVGTGKLLFGSIIGILFQLLPIQKLNPPTRDGVHFHGLLDTRPFFHYLLRTFPWPKISQNIQRGLLDTLTISATNTLTGDIEFFMQSRPEQKFDYPHMRKSKITPRHIMASAALPVLFPAVQIDGHHYNDGSMRLNTPLMPAVHLGSNQLWVIGTSDPEEHAEPDPEAVPRLADFVGSFVQAVLHDRLEADQAQLLRINRILKAVQNHTDAATYQAIKNEARVQQIDAITFSPSQSIAEFVDQELQKSLRSLETFGMMERMILRLLEVDEHSGRHLLSYFLFETSYVDKLIELGYQDAKARHDEICAFVMDA